MNVYSKPLSVALFVSYRCNLTPFSKEEKPFFFFKNKKKHFNLECFAWLGKVFTCKARCVRHTMYFDRDNGKLLMLYQGFSKHSNFLSSQLDQTGLSVPILDRDPHQSNNTGSHRLVICQYLVGTWNTETSRIKNIFSHRIWWHSKILFVPPLCTFWGKKRKQLSHCIHFLRNCSYLMSTS